jgi:hypothetical protein
MSTEQRYVAVEDENVDQEGFILVPTRDAGASYASKSQTALFSTEAEAREVVSALITKGMIGFNEMQVRKAKLSHHRKLEVEVVAADLSDAPASGLIVLP